MTAETEPIIKRKALRLSTTETTTALDTGTVVMMSAEEAQRATAEIKAKFGDLRKTIHEFEAREGWRALGYESFRSWAVAEIDQVGVRQVYRLLAAAEAESNLGVTIGHTPESQLRPLAGLPAEQQRAAWELAEEIAGDGPRQAAHVAAAAQAVGDLDPLTEEELIELSGLGGWELDASATARPGTITMRLCRGDHWEDTETRSPGGWRYELGRLRAESEARIERAAQSQRQADLIERAKAVGLVMTAGPSGKITFKLEDGTAYGGAKNLEEAESRIKQREDATARSLKMQSPSELPPGFRWRSEWAPYYRVERIANETLSNSYHTPSDAVAWAELQSAEPISFGHVPGWSKSKRLEQLQASNDPMAPTALAELFAAHPDLAAPPAPPATQPTCRDCGGGFAGRAMYSDRCEGCYHIRQANARLGQPDEPSVNGQSMVSWHLDNARKFHAANPGQLARIAGIESVVAEIERAEAAAPAVVAVPASPANRRSTTAHAASVLAGLLEKIEPAELRLLYLLVVGDEIPYGADDQDVSESIWTAAGEAIDSASDETLAWASEGATWTIS